MNITPSRAMLLGGTAALALGMGISAAGGEDRRVGSTRVIDLQASVALGALMFVAGAARGGNDALVAAGMATIGGSGLSMLLG